MYAKKPGMTNSRMAHYQGLLCENPWVQLETMWTLSPTTFLPMESETPGHNCEEVIGEVYSSRLDQMDITLQNPELELFTVRNSFIQDRQHKAGYAVTTTDEIVKVRPCYKGGQHNGLSYGHSPRS